MAITYKDIRTNEEIRAFIRKGNANLHVLGYTDHSEAHSGLVADSTAFDIHDRVNYAVIENKLNVNVEDKRITLDLVIDESVCTMYEYFDIFLQRMLLSRAAAELLGARFHLVVNGTRIL